ncbi:hypothetical protein RRG08_008500 [Elysia crispata]|uniref:Uncharacterized protein n=1 Tax=Elysia crispata TaxID=231223 RepID=A0AAE1DCR5_9GAST|nr:hypothetical protein RRG08_008500 [Elysia crispata]
MGGWGRSGEAGGWKPLTVAAMGGLGDGGGQERLVDGSHSPWQRWGKGGHERLVDGSHSPWHDFFIGGAGGSAVRRGW